MVASAIASLAFHKQLFDALAAWAKKWRDVRGGWMILWAITFVVSHPPLIGYSTCVMLGGIVYGFPNGYVLLVCVVYLSW